MQSEYQPQCRIDSRDPQALISSVSSNIQSQRARLIEAVAAKARHGLPESDDLGLVQLTVRGKRIEQRERHENPPRLPPTHGTVVRLSDYTSTCWLNGRQCEQTVEITRI
jgi:hypothetical protein